MAAWGYDFIFLCWKYLSLVRFAHSWEILSVLEDKIRIPARPWNILYIIHFKWKYKNTSQKLK